MSTRRRDWDGRTRTVVSKRKASLGNNGGKRELVARLACGHEAVITGAGVRVGGLMVCPECPECPEWDGHHAGNPR